MTNWKTVTLAGLAALSCGLSPANAEPKHKSSPAYAALPPMNREYIKKTFDSFALVDQGDASVKRFAWKEAKQDYQQALDLLPDSKPALYGLAKCSQNDGDIPKAIEYYREAIYSANPAAKGFGETNTSRLMELALLLNKTGQVDEAILVYNHAAFALDYQDSENHNGQPHLKVLFPEIMRERIQADQVRYTPERLQALADALLACKMDGFWSYKEIKAHAQEAARLYPDSAAVQYYVGEALSGSYYAVIDSPAKDKPAALAAYEEDKKAETAAYKKAAELGDDRTTAAAKERLGMLR